MQEFGLLSLCEDIELQMKKLLMKVISAHNKGIEMLKKNICQLGNKMPISPSSSEASSRSESSDECSTSSDESSLSNESNPSSSCTSSSLGGFFYGYHDTMRLQRKM